MVTILSRIFMFLSILIPLGLSLLFLLRAPELSELTLQPHQSTSFRVCFPPPRIGPPQDIAPSEIDRIRGMLETEREKRGISAEATDWLLALALHESGGRKRAVSPTGCGGLFAFSRTTEPVQQCCRLDGEDHYLYEYDLCNHESKVGFQCEYDRDTRFDEALSIKRAFDDYQKFSALVSSAQLKGHFVEPATALSIFWNSGPESVPFFPNSLHSSHAAISQLNVSDFPPYLHWSLHSAINKIIETYDYIEWIRSLHSYLSHRGMPKDEGSMICVEYHPRSVGVASESRVTRVSRFEEALIRWRFPKVRVLRLMYGEYKPEYVWLNLATTSPD